MVAVSFSAESGSFSAGQWSFFRFGLGLGLGLGLVLETDFYHIRYK